MNNILKFMFFILVTAFSNFYKCGYDQSLASFQEPLVFLISLTKLNWRFDSLKILDSEKRLFSLNPNISLSGQARNNNIYLEAIFDLDIQNHSNMMANTKIGSYAAIFVPLPNVFFFKTLNKYLIFNLLIGGLVDHSLKPNLSLGLECWVFRNLGLYVRYIGYLSAGLTLRNRDRTVVSDRLDELIALQKKNNILLENLINKDKLK